MTNRVGIRSWLIFTIAAIFYLYELALRVSPSVMTGELMSTFSATSTMLGLLISFYYYAYTILQLPCGIILDKMGPRNLLGTSAILCVLGSVLFAKSEGIYVAQIGRFIVGAGSACAFISCLQIAANLFPKSYFVVLAGITNMMGTLGGLFGGPPVAKMVNRFGWQDTTYFLAAIGVVIVFLIFLFIPKEISKDPVPKRTTEPVVHNVAKLIKNPQVVLSGIVAAFMYLPVDAFAELWAVPFFMEKYSINNEKASLLSAVIFIGVAIGSVVLAIFARKIRSYMKTIRISVILTALLFVQLIYFPGSIGMAFATVFAIGFFTGAQPISFTCAKNNATAELSGTTLALTNCIVMLMGCIFQPLLGMLLDCFWAGKFDAAGVRVYDAKCYEHAILIIPVCLFVTYIISRFVKENTHIENI